MAWAKWGFTAKRSVLRIWQLHYLCFGDFTLPWIAAWSHWLLGLVFCLCLTHNETVCIFWGCSTIKTKVCYAGMTETSSSQIFDGDCMCFPNPAWAGIYLWRTAGPPEQKLRIRFSSQTRTRQWYQSERGQQSIVQEHPAIHLVLF